MIIADTNEFHPLTDAVAYRDEREADGSNHPIIIMRATYGPMKVDNAYVASLIRARNADLRVGHYGYLVQIQDAAEQGHFFGEIVKQYGGLKIGDTIWCDAEEGQGDQLPRIEAWLKAAHEVLGDPTSDEGVYSDAAFWNAHIGNPPQPLRWIATFGPNDPHLAGEDLWQFTSARVFAGIDGPCDASIYHGNVADFLKLIGEEPHHVQKGPFRNVVPAGNKLSIDDLAKERNENPNEIVRFSFIHENLAHAAILHNYMSLRGSLSHVGAPSPVLPEGLVFWTKNQFTWPS